MNIALLIRGAMTGSSSEIRIKYGYLYNWYVTQGTGNASIAPIGWHVPTDAELTTLTNYVAANLGTSVSEAKALAATTDWTTWHVTGTVGNNPSINNYSGFSARPGGSRLNTDGTFHNVGNGGNWWSSTEIYTSNAYYMHLFYNNSNVNRYNNAKSLGFSVRLVKDAPDPSESNMIGNDGTSYKTVHIGTQTWMAENSAETKYRGGTDITNITSDTAWAALTSGARCAYNNDEANVFMTPVVNTITSSTSIKYGYLYNWYAVNDSRKIAPIGWHVATDAEWTTLETYVSTHLGTSVSVAKALASTTDWKTYSTVGTVGDNPSINNYSGFSARPGGYRSSGGAFGGVGSNGYWWSSTEYSSSYTYYRKLSNYNSGVSRSSLTKSSGFSVRLIRDEQDLSASNMIGNDGTSYKTVNIGTQTWMAENLAETKYRNGLNIVNTVEPTQWATLTQSSYCAYNNVITNAYTIV